MGWGLADQVVSSLTNFAVGIYVVHALGAVQFGAFSLAYVTYGFVLNASRGLATDPLMVRFSGTDLPTWRRAVADSTGTATVVGLALGACVLAAVAVLDGTTGAAFLALGLTLPGLLLQDSWRYSFFALGRGGQAFLNDTIWALTLLPALVVLHVTGHADVFWFVFAWGTTATIAAAAGALQARVIPRPDGTWGWMSEHRDLGPRYLAQGTAQSAAVQLRAYGIGFVLGLATLGSVQAAATLFGPMTILFLGMSLVTIPEAARVLRRSPRHLPLFCLVITGGLSMAALAWGIILLVAVPRGFGSWLLGPIWRSTYPLVLPQMFFVIGQGIGAGEGTGLGALGAARAEPAPGSSRVGSFRYRLSRRRCCGRSRWDIVGRRSFPMDQRSVRVVAAARGDAGCRPPTCRSPVPVDSPELRRQSSPVLAADRRPGDRTKTRSPVPAPPARRAVAARVLLATGGAALLAVIAATGWTLAHGLTGTHSAADAHARTTEASAHASAAARTPAIAHRGESTQVLKPVSAVSFDPYGGGHGENNQLADLAIDGNPAEAWHTEWYASASFGNLKPGTGLLLDMGQTVTITNVRLLLGKIPGADFQVRVGAVASSLTDLHPVGYATDAGGQVSLHLTRPASGRYVLIWLTHLPPDASGTFEASIADVSLEGGA